MQLSLVAPTTAMQFRRRVAVLALLIFCVVATGVQRARATAAMAALAARASSAYRDSAKDESVRMKEYVLGSCSPAMVVSENEILITAAKRSMAVDTKAYAIGSEGEDLESSDGGSGGTQDLVAVRMNFGPIGQKFYFNPNVLPLPRKRLRSNEGEHSGEIDAYNDGAEFLGFARYGEETLHEVRWCRMSWQISRVTGKRHVACTTRETPRALKNPSFGWLRDQCPEELFFLESDQGLVDQRVFFSPFGEPLMIVGTNSHYTCLGLYLIDLRVLTPTIGAMLAPDDGRVVPVRYNTWIELLDTPAKMNTPLKKNWYLLWDLDNVAYISRNAQPQDISRLDDLTFANVAATNEDCFGSSVELSDVVAVHQATNSLRLTLCDFPCEPTANNTVLVSIVHVKHVYNGDVVYKRHVIVMEPSAPFRIIAYSRNLIYAGTDESEILYSVSLAWNMHDRTRPTWDEYLASAAPKDEAEGETTVEDDVNQRIRLHRLQRRALPPPVPKPKSNKIGKKKPSGNAGSDAKTPAPAKPKAGEYGSKKYQMSLMEPYAIPLADKKKNAPMVNPTDWIPVQEFDHSKYSDVNMPLQYPSSPLVSDFYHGWLDDTIIVSFGLQDAYSGLIEVTARRLVECLVMCNV
ncbi:uncharacterized protein V1518DRAFT_415629 [Limtongia smithiae]|uniref:uncharacterized protein n=1 Tax=Limtongia smithiae TaxID=1125753 RepID=UPI0034CE0DFC